MENVKTFFAMLKKLISMLERKQKREGIILMFLLMFVSLMEMLSVGVIVPFITAMLEPQKLMENEYIRRFIKSLDLSNEHSFVIVMAVGIILVYFLKNSFILFVNYFQSTYRNNLERDLNIKMLSAYMKHPYQYFVETNSANIIRGVNNDMMNVATVVDNYSTIFSEGLNAIVIGIFLICLSPNMAIALLLIAALTALLIILSFKRRISEYGEKAREAFTEKYKDICHAVDGIKEITVADRRDYFVGKFAMAAKKASEINTKYLWISKVPNRLIETIFISGLVSVVVITVGETNSNLNFITQLGAVGVAAVRILPSISILTSAMNSLIYLRPSLDEAYINMQEVSNYVSGGQINHDRNSKLRFEHELTLDRIYWRYQEDLPWVLQDLSLKIRKGTAIGIIGESGAGKTTLADVLLGLYSPQKGKVLLDEYPISGGIEWAKMVGYVPQAVYLMDDTVRNNIAFGVETDEIDEQAVWRAVEQAQLIKTIKELPGGLSSMVGERGIKLSGGQRQRIAIARALYRDPEIIVLDEATSALDNDTEQAIMEAIDTLQGKKTLIIIAHRLTTIQKCDAIYKVENGKAISCKINEILPKNA